MAPQTAQILLIALGILQFVGGATAQLDVLFGPSTEKLIGAALALVGGSLSIVVAVLIPKPGAAELAAMTGVHLTVSANAGPELAQMALDPKVTNVTAAPGAMAALEQTVKNS